MLEVLQSIIELLVGGITGIASGIGSGLNDLVTQIFVTTSETGEVTGLSIFGGLIAVFGGIALAVGLSKLVVGWVMSLGARNRA